MISLFIVFAVSFVLSAFFSGAEMAFVTGSKFTMRHLADAGNKAAKTIVHLFQYPQRFLTTVLIGNNIVNITTTAICTLFLEMFFQVRNGWVATAIMAPLLIVFAEMVPKDYGRLRSHDFLLASAGWLDLFSKIFYYPTVLLLKGVDFFLSRLGERGHKSIFVDQEEFRLLIDESTKSGVVSDHEKRLIDTILDFERIRIESVMTPVDKIPKVPFTGTVQDVKDLVRRTPAKMVLVYEEIPSIIVGMIYVFDLLFEENESQGLKNYLRSPIFLPLNTSNEKAFLTLQNKRQSYAAVTNPAGDVIGAVAIERLLVI